MLRNKYRFHSFHLIILSVISVLFPRICLCLAPPLPGDFEKYRKDGTLAQRLAFVESLENYKISPQLLEQAKVRSEMLKEKGEIELSALPFPAGLPSIGSPKVFALLIEFPGTSHAQNPSVFENKLFGDGDPGEYPYESLRKYYQRSSYSKLDLQGNVLGWYQAEKTRGHYTGYPATLIKEAITHFDEAGHDFSQYDNNGDGKIDYFMVMWTGADTGWGSFWWAWCDTSGSVFRDDPFTVDGKRLGVFSWQWEKKTGANHTVFKASTVIHETGHGLGLPDLYDYYDSLDVGPKGGVGGLDIMDGGGDHNAYHKWLLGWLTPTFVGASNTVHSLSLLPSGYFGSCAIIMPGASETAPFSEFFLVQNRKRIRNDTVFPNDGVLIFHIDARLNATNDNFLYNNSWTEHKYIKVMEADGLEEIENGKGWDPNDFYQGGDIFTPYSTPDSSNYAGNLTGVSVGNISSGLFFMKADFLISSHIHYLWEAVDNFNLLWTTGGAAPWFRQTAVFHHDNDAARSGFIGHNKESVIETRCTGPGTLSFFWKVSSELDKDFLSFYINDTLQDSISGEADWSQRIFPVGYGTHKLSWKYSKDGSGASGSDCGYLDKVEFSSATPLGEAVDNPLYSFTTGGSATWYGQTIVSYFGGDSAQSPLISHNQSSRMETEISGPGVLKFFWKVSSQESADYLEFYIDNNLRDQISGEVDWHQKTYNITTGKHTLKWQYVKDGSVSEGMDAGWVDKVELAISILSAAVDNAQMAFITDGDAGWFHQNTTWYYDNDAAQSPIFDGSSDGRYNSNLKSFVEGPGTLKFWWKEDESSTRGDLYFYMDNLFKEYTFGTDWEQKIIAIPPGMHSITWKYEFWGNPAEEMDHGWVDKVEYSREVSLEEALDQPNFAWFTGGIHEPNLWFGQNQTWRYGDDAAQSGIVENNEWSWLEGRFSGAGSLKFFRKVSSQLNSDYYEFYIDSSLKERISGDVDWEEKSYILGAGDHVIRWEYRKDASGKAGDDCAWVDRVRIEGYLMSLGEALDNKSYSWLTSGNADWFGQGDVFFHDGDAAQSGEITHNQHSQIETTVQGPGLLKFHWKASSQWSDYLSFLLDGDMKLQIGGEVDWEERVFLIPPGAHQIQWRYAKDSAFSDGRDCGWLDRVIFDPAPSIAEAVDNADLEWSSGGDAVWFGQTLESHHDGDAAICGEIADGQESWIETTVTGPGQISFYWKASSQEGGDFLKFFANDEEMASISGEVGWEWKIFNFDIGDHHLVWKYKKDASGKGGADRGWVDFVDYQRGEGFYTIYVPQTYSTIQKAIDASLNGWTVIVSKKREPYYENINFKGKNITLRSTDPTNLDVIQNTIINGMALGPAVKFSGSEDSSCVIMGFTITNGKNAGGDGGGVEGNRTNATIQNNIIAYNLATNGGGIGKSGGVIRNNVIYENQGGYGGGIYFCPGAIYNNTLYHNIAVTAGNAMSHCDGEIRNCIMWQAKGVTPNEIYNCAAPSYSCIAGWEGGGTGNLTTNPSFLDPLNYDFRLKTNSPCIDAGGAIADFDFDLEGNPRPTSESGALRGDGSNFDIGAFESSLKTLIINHLLGKRFIPISLFDQADTNADNKINAADLVKLIQP